MKNANFAYTQNIIVRTDLNISKGKMCGQVAHAAVAAVEAALDAHRDWFAEWFEEGQRKVILKVNSLEELLELKRKAEEIDLPVALVEDLGLTELPPGTVTCLGIGPALTNIVDKVTRGLHLL